MPRETTVHQLKALRDRRERHALLDVREKGEFNLRQIPNSTPVPRGLLELRAPALIPDRNVPVVLICQDGRRSALAASTLRRMGYRDVADVQGGLDAWVEAGYPTWEGTGVPGKEYGEKVSVVARIPQITPEELASRLSRGGKFVIMDSRTAEEYRQAHLPGAYSVPGGELLTAAIDLATDPESTIVVNCAGRTRSILGAYLLRRMGLPNPICGFKNGTMAWKMAGYELEQGKGRPCPPVSPEAREAAEQFAARMARDEGLSYLPVQQLRRWQQSGELHYLIDVRLPEEYVRGHIPGALSCPAGQLALQSEDFVAVHDAPIVLTCDLRARATYGASLYTRMGFPHVYVLDGGTTAWMESGYLMETKPPETEVFGLKEARARGLSISPGELRGMLERGEPVALVDVRGSGDYALGHIAGSRWIARGSLELRAAEELPDRNALVVAVCDDGIRSALAATTLRDLGYVRARPLDGGPARWREAGLPLEEGLQGAKVSLEEAKGDVPPAMRRGVLERTRGDMERYLSWEEELGKKFES